MCIAIETSYEKHHIPHDKRSLSSYTILGLDHTLPASMQSDIAKALTNFLKAIKISI